MGRQRSAEQPVTTAPRHACIPITYAEWFHKTEGKRVRLGMYQRYRLITT